MPCGKQTTTVARHPYDRTTRCVSELLPLVTEDQQQILYLHRLRQRIQLQVSAARPGHTQPPRHVWAIRGDLDIERGQVPLTEMQATKLAHLRNRHRVRVGWRWRIK